MIDTFIISILIQDLSREAIIITMKGYFVIVLLAIALVCKAYQPPLRTNFYRISSNKRIANPLRATNDYNNSDGSGSQVARMKAMAAQLRAEAAVIEAERRKEDIDKLSKIFDSFDANKDGSVSVQELKDGLTAQFKDTVSEEQAKKIMKLFDSSGDGKLQLDEFQPMQSFRLKLDKIIKEEKMSVAEARKKAFEDQQAAEQAANLARLINNDPPTTSDKIFSILPYFLPLADALPYANYLITSSHLDTNPAFAIFAILLTFYQRVPFGGLLAFIFFNYLSSNLKLNRLVRFNIQQAIFFDIFLIFPGLAGSIVEILSQYSNNPVPVAITEISTTGTFLVVLTAVLYSVGLTLTGNLPTGVPFVSDRVLERVPTTEEFMKMFDEEGNFIPPNRKRNNANDKEKNKDGE